MLHSPYCIYVFTRLFVFFFLDQSRQDLVQTHKSQMSALENENIQLKQSLHHLKQAFEDVQQKLIETEEECRQYDETLKSSQSTNTKVVNCLYSTQNGTG